MFRARSGAEGTGCGGRAPTPAEQQGWKDLPWLPAPTPAPLSFFIDKRFSDKGNGGGSRTQGKKTQTLPAFCTNSSPKASYTAAILTANQPHVAGQGNSRRTSKGGPAMAFPALPPEDCPPAALGRCRPSPSCLGETTSGLGLWLGLPHLLGGVGKARASRRLLTFISKSLNYIHCSILLYCWPVSGEDRDGEVTVLLRAMRERHLKSRNFAYHTEKAKRNTMK